MGEFYCSINVRSSDAEGGKAPVQGSAAARADEDIPFTQICAHASPERVYVYEFSK